MSPIFKPLVINILSAVLVPASTLICCAFPSFTTYTILPFKTGITASVGTKMAFLMVANVSFICANEPGKSSPEELSANALICNVLVCWLTPGSIANTFPLNTLV